MDINVTTVSATTPVLNNITFNSENVAWLVIGILIVATNLFVLLIILFNRRLHDPSNIILCSMLVSGCAITVFYILPGRVFTKWRLATVFLCSTMPSFAFASLTCYNLHICAIYIIKAVPFVASFRYRKLTSIRYTAYLLLLLWSIPYVASFTPLFTYRLYSSQACVYINHSRTAIQNDQIFQFIFFKALIFIPITAAIVLYVIAYIAIKNLPPWRPSIETTLKLRRTLYKMKYSLLVRQIIFMLGLCAICWLPFFVMFIILQFRFYPPERMIYSILRYLALSHPIINPILFAYFTRSIHDAIKYNLCINTSDKKIYPILKFQL